MEKAINELIDTITTCAKKARSEFDGLKAMQLTQAALNAANTARCLHEVVLIERAKPQTKTPKGSWGRATSSDFEP